MRLIAAAEQATSKICVPMVIAEGAVLTSRVAVNLASPLQNPTERKTLT